ncbi:hypothetical protein IFT43_13750 [Oxalobacteraceae sp. CFBP 13708]|jgi:hypothetical protein|nr:hypothetical protein [Oxalobacteraceae sp. CFBP 13708]
MKQDDDGHRNAAYAINVCAIWQMLSSDDCLTISVHENSEENSFKARLSHGVIVTERYLPAWDRKLCLFCGAARLPSRAQGGRSERRTPQRHRFLH